MAVRTAVAGIKNPQSVDARAAQPSQQASKGKMMLPHDEAAMLRREQALARVTLGPAAVIHEHKSHRRATLVQGRKKAPSEMGIKREGGPADRSLLHGG
jgi:hypothetical protein